jgi:hypothetical protein
MEVAKSNTFTQTRKNVGYYQITGKGGVEGSFRIMFINKPSRIHRFFCRILIGWYWSDIE